MCFCCYLWIYYIKKKKESSNAFALVYNIVSLKWPGLLLNVPFLWILISFGCWFFTSFHVRSFIHFTFYLFNILYLLNAVLKLTEKWIKCMAISWVWRVFYSELDENYDTRYNLYFFLWSFERIESFRMWCVHSYMQLHVKL